MMPKFFTANNRNFMEVTPVDSLLNSTMVKSVLKRGDKFVVDMNTGKLTVLSVPKAAPKPAAALAIMVRYKNDELEAQVAKSPQQAVFYSEDARNRWGIADQELTFSFGVNNAVLKFDENTHPDTAKRLIYVMAKEVQSV